MSHPILRKDLASVRVAPNLGDYAEACRGAPWDDARSRLSGLPDGAGLNIAFEAVDRHAAGPRADQVAIRWLGKDGRRQDLSFTDLRDLTNRFANVLDGLGVGIGEAVFLLLGRVPELYVAAFGAL